MRQLFPNSNSFKLNKAMTIEKMCFLITSFHSQEIFNIGCYHAKSDSTVVLDKKLTSPRSLFASGCITDSMVLYPKSHWFYRIHIFFWFCWGCLLMFFFPKTWVVYAVTVVLDGLISTIPYHLTGHFLSQCIRKREHTEAVMKCSSLEEQDRLLLLTIFSRVWFHSLA